MSENTELGDEVRTAQENLRLSANTVAKLNNQLKIVCNENEELKSQLQALGGANRKNMSEMQNKIAMFSQ